MFSADLDLLPEFVDTDRNIFSVVDDLTESLFCTIKSVGKLIPQKRLTNELNESPFCRAKVLNHPPQMKHNYQN
jgi:hypothetical protein